MPFGAKPPAILLHGDLPSPQPEASSLRDGLRVPPKEKFRPSESTRLMGDGHGGIDAIRLLGNTSILINKFK
jgi:hypothetical protein